MAFTEAEKNQIAMILGKPPIEVAYWLSFNAVNITAQVETDVRTQLTRWTTYGVKFVRLTATESNKGVNTNSDEVKDDIKQNIAVLLGLDPMQIGVGSGTYLPRS